MTDSTTVKTRARFVILALLAIGTMINYLDRTVLGIAAPSLTKDLGIDAAQMGIVFSAFGWTYAAMQIPGGVFLDKFGSKITYGLALVAWSFMTLLHAFAGGLSSLIGLRFGLGISESPCFPTNSRVVGTWFPMQERARATGVYTVGEYIGLAFLSPGLFWLLGNYGWRSLFIVVGIAGIIFGAIWWRMYTEPHESKTANAAELEYIGAGGGLAPKAASVPFEFASIRKLFQHRQIWGVCIGQFCINSTLVFFLTWFPTYLATERHMGWMKVGFYATLPFMAAAVGVMVAGIFSDYLFKRTGSANIARKTPIIMGLLLTALIVGANYADNDQLVIAIMSVAFFGQGMAGLAWVLISDIAPKNLMGLTGGVFNFSANLASIVIPLVIGFTVAATGSFVGALAVIGTLGLIGALTYVFVLGDVKRIEIV